MAHVLSRNEVKEWLKIGGLLESLFNKKVNSTVTLHWRHDHPFPQPGQRLDAYSLEKAKLRHLDTGYQAIKSREVKVKKGKKQQKIS